MKKVLLSLVMMILPLTGAVAQNPLNDAADNIIGVYYGSHDGEGFLVKIFKLTDGTYRGQVIWMDNDTDSKGNKRLDTKNPDKKLRSTPCDRIVIFSGLKYDPAKKQWGDTKIYDPQRGIKAKLTVCFDEDGRLKLRGSVLGIGESVYWDKETD